VRTVSSSVAWALACALLVLVGCAGGDEEPPPPPPVLTLAQTTARSFTISISGEEPLRALQAELRYDDGALEVTQVAAGRDAKRIDRLFAGDPAQAAGRLMLGITDTRRVLLPTRGELFVISFLGRDSAERAEVVVERALGIDNQGRRTPLIAVSGELVLK